MNFCNTLNDLVTYVQSKQQLCTHLLYDSPVGQHEYTKQPKDSILCYVIDTKLAVLLTFTNELVLLYVF